MNNKLYYTIEIDYEDDYITGNKTIAVYKIENNKPMNILELYLELDDDTVSNIMDNLDEDEYTDDTELIQL